MIWNTGDITPDFPLVPLASIALKVGSGATPRGGRSAYPDSGTPLIRSQNVRFEGFVPEGLAHLTDTQAAHLDGVKVEAGDVLLNITGASIGRVCVAPPDMAGARVNQHVCIIRTRGSLPEFVAAYIASPQVQDAISSGNYGVTREALTKAQILELPIPVPSTEIQRAFVARLERLYQKRESAAEHLRSAVQGLDHFRHAALAAAFVEATTENGGLEVPLERLLREPLKNGYSARPVGHTTPFRVLTLTATTSGWFNERYFKFTDEEFKPDSPFWVCPGDILIQRGNTPEYVGVPALYEGARCEFIYPDLMIRARVRDDIDPRFVWYMLLAPQARMFVRSRATGSAGNMPKVNQKILNLIPVPLPTTETRERIVDKLDSALALADAALSILNAGHQKLDKSWQAVLAKAFRGEMQLSKPS